MLKTIHAKWLAEYLMKKGFKVIEIEQDKKNPNRIVWKFEYTPNLLNTLSDVFSNR